MRLFTVFILICLSAFSLSASEASRVLVLANANEPESLELARYYAFKRGIPEKNILSFPMPGEEEITWDSFVESIYNPLRTLLVEKEWVQGSLIDGEDRQGRTQAVCYGSSIDYLVLCRGVPLKIKNDQGRYTEEEAALPPGEALYALNEASVDSELALLAQPETPLSWLAPNPLYGLEAPKLLTAYPAGSVRVDKELLSNPMFKARKQRLLMNNLVVKVARLDGPTLASAKALVDHALEGERWGLIGRAYVDLGGPHERGDMWIQEAGSILEAQGYDVDYERTKGAFPIDARFDAPAFYLGWWFMHPQGAIAAPWAEFAPGALAYQLHSFSARTVRDPIHYWVGPFVSKGAAGTVGSVYEPYLDAFYRPELLMRALVSGKEWGEAAYYALPFLSWQMVLIGDPLYRPFKISLDAQLLMIQSGKEVPNAQYAVIRKINVLLASGKVDRALATGEQYFKKVPGIALALKIAEVQNAQGDKEAAMKTIAFVSGVTVFYGEERLVGLAVAQLMSELGDKEHALELYKHLLDGMSDSDALTQAILEDAIRSAKNLGDVDLMLSWQERLDRAQGKLPVSDAKKSPSRKKQSRGRK